MKHANVIVVGAGPAGIAAAATAARHGQSVLVLDDNPAAGGQIWRGGREAPHPHTSSAENTAKSQALRKLASSGATLLPGHRVFDAAAPSTLHALKETAAGSEVVAFRYDHLILATGARERFLPFPGWTLPGVFGAGGLQALVKGGFPVQGKRIAVAGSGPLLLAVAAHLREFGAHLTSVSEQASISQLAPFAASLWSHPAKILQGIRYRKALGKAPYLTGCWPVRATANNSTGLLQSIHLTDGTKTWEEPCDLLACGFHLVPNTELASLLGCALHENFVQVNSLQQTSVANIYCAGEPTGIAGLDAALVQGEIAALACSGKPTGHLRARNAAEQKFAYRLEKAFRLRPELRSLASSDTIVCRCEDVTHATLSGRTGWTDAKLQTRCGMGPCQGRICGPAVETIFGWKPQSVRPPLFPVPLNALCFHEHNSKPQAIPKEIS
jgi:NADPH-dependent 2,4-dienoyl-CoA reductase/sulfur reductase-like enzyme